MMGRGQRDGEGSGLQALQVRGQGDGGCQCDGEGSGLQARGHGDGRGLRVARNWLE